MIFYRKYMNEIRYHYKIHEFVIIKIFNMS